MAKPSPPLAAALICSLAAAHGALATQGRSVVSFVVSPEGKAGSPTLLRSSGHPLLDDATLSHLERCLRLHADGESSALPPGQYALPMVWRIE